MGSSRTNKGTSSFLTQWQFDSGAWLGQLDAKSDQVLTAIKELGDTYQYASLRFSAAVDFAQKLRELKSERSGSNTSDVFSRTCQEYGAHIEDLLGALAGALRKGITEGPLENYILSAVADIESLGKSLLG